MIITSCLAAYLLVGLLLAFKETRETQQIIQSDKPYDLMSNDDKSLVDSFRSMSGIVPKNVAIKLFFVSVMLFWFPTQSKIWYDKAWARIFK